ncbi:MAG: signal peptide peptidase SppA [Verrucomicrobiota bacterium]
MKDFLKIVLGNLTAQAIVVCTGFIFLMIFMVMLIVGGSNEPVRIQNGSIVVVDLWANISDSPQSESLSEAIGNSLNGSYTPNYYLLELIDGIERAAEDDDVDGLFLHGSLLPVGYGSGLATVSEVRDALIAFKETGKPIYAYLVDPDISDFYLMSVADKLYMNPYGLVSLNGLAAEAIYFGDAFKKYGIGVQATKVGKYKSAVETFTGNSMSSADREQLTELIDDLWMEIVTDIADSRDMSGQQLMELTDDPGFFIADQAVEFGLIDQSAYFDEVIADLQENHKYDGEIDSFAQVAMSDYIATQGFRAGGPPLWPSANQIAIVYAEGEIVDGEGYPEQVGGDRLARQLRDLREDGNVAAIVLRVNSPGGSAVASEVIQREVRMAAETKPVVVSMGSYAASGGYWISAYADRIFAEPATVTGSIGVFGLIPNFKELANNHGVTFDGVKTSNYADLFTISRPKTDAEMELIQQFTDYLYVEFINKVAEGRDLPVDEVQEIAQGRVWSGLDAHKIGLVDEIGGLRTAINYAAEEAGVSYDFSIIQVPEAQGLAESIAMLMESAPGAPPLVRAPTDDIVEATIGRIKRDLEMVRSFNDPRGVYARLPFSVEIR